MKNREKISEEGVFRLDGADPAAAERERARCRRINRLCRERLNIPIQYPEVDTLWEHLRGCVMYRCRRMWAYVSRRR